jgi:hypothetical protein
MVGFKIPSAIPATQRPTIMRATPLEAVWNTDPTIVKKVEMRSVFLRPSFSRRNPLKRLPMAFPADPMETMAPWRLLTLFVPGGNM